MGGCPVKSVLPQRPSIRNFALTIRKLNKDRPLTAKRYDAAQPAFHFGPFGVVAPYVSVFWHVVSSILCRRKFIPPMPRLTRVFLKDLHDFIPRYRRAVFDTVRVPHDIIYLVKIPLKALALFFVPLFSFSLG